MLLRWEIDDPPRAAKRASFSDKHPANLDLMVFASVFVSKEVARECLFEHQSDSLAHHSHRIDRVHQRFNRRFEKIALDESHHLKVPIRLDGCLDFSDRADQARTFNPALNRTRITAYSH